MHIYKNLHKDKSAKYITFWKRTLVAFKQFLTQKPASVFKKRSARNSESPMSVLKVGGMLMETWEWG